MKAESSNNQDEALRKVLKEWCVEAPLPPRFQEQVWRRIERVQSTSVPSLLGVVSRWVEMIAPRRGLAAAYLAGLLAIGITTGWVNARHETARVKNELGQRYVRLLDPYQAPRN